MCVVCHKENIKQNFNQEEFYVFQAEQTTKKMKSSTQPMLEQASMGSACCNVQKLIAQVVDNASSNQYIKSKTKYRIQLLSPEYYQSGN